MLLKLMRAERFGIFRGNFNIPFQVQHALNIIKRKAAKLAALQSLLDRLLSRFPQPLCLAAGGDPFNAIFYFLIDLLELLNIFL